MQIRNADSQGHAHAGGYITEAGRAGHHPARSAIAAHTGGACDIQPADQGTPIAVSTEPLHDGGGSQGGYSGVPHGHRAVWEAAVWVAGVAEGAHRGDAIVDGVEVMDVEGGVRV